MNEPARAGGVAASTSAETVTDVIDAGIRSSGNPAVSALASTFCANANAGCAVGMSSMQDSRVDRSSALRCSHCAS